MAAILTNPSRDSVAAISELSALVLDRPEQFLQPTAQLQQVAVEAAKAFLDPLAADIAHLQITRRNENRRKRKRGESGEEQPVLQLRQLYTQGFGVKQVWEQARKILDAAQLEADKTIHLNRPTVTNGKSGNSEDDSLGEEQEEIFNENESNAGELDLEEDMDGLQDEDLDLEEEDDNGQPDGETEEEGDENVEAESDLGMSENEDDRKPRDIFIKDPNGLNDGFFSIDDFNKQSQFLEQMDARGDDDNPSDEDEVDWDADPLAMLTAKSANGKSKSQTQGVNDSGSEEDGPTFGDADLDASEDEDLADFDEDQDLGEAIGGLSNANDIRYADFFEPPAKKPSKTKRMRALPKTQPTATSAPAGRDDPQPDTEQLQNDIERAMADVRRDLLDSEDEDDISGDDEGISDDSLRPRKSRDSGKNLSTHEKQRAAIAVEIRKLEAANVAKRDWQLSGEARAADRPLNSLIEEDLEFERTGKPIAPVTAETTDEIDALIKRRILAREFDEVIRRVPGSLNLAGDTRRGRIEVDDSKPQASLGEIYENEHQKKVDPLSYVNKRSAATKKQHDEIEILWKQVREQLDALSNLHFKPKRVDVEIKTVEDKPRITMEDARPVGEIESGEGGMLAPQEVYRPGVDRKGGKDEVMLPGGAALSREEMSREEKLRRRRREKERSKKAQGNRDLNILGKKNSNKQNRTREKNNDKANIIEDLKRGGVKVVGKEGELQSIGKQKKGQNEGGEVNGSNLKL